MKYILLCAAALLVCLVCAWLPARLIGKKKRLGRGAVALLGLGFALLLICAVTFGYLGVYYHADPEAAAVSDRVKTEKIDGGYFFDGPGEDCALIFYPGAKVDTLAYAPLMTALAEKGVDCFLADMPFRMAIFGSDRAAKFQEAYSYETWVAAGHSMGGLAVSSYVADNADRIDCLILLAAYPGKSLPEDLTFLSIYGTKDGCLNREVYEESRGYWPEAAEEYVISGGNHAQYADYGPQSGDMEAEISRAEQQELTVELILDAVKALQS